MGTGDRFRQRYTREISLPFEVETDLYNDKRDIGFIANHQISHKNLTSLSQTIHRQ